MIRTQISLTAAQMSALRQLAHRRETSIAAVVRDAVDVAVDDDAQRPRIRRALDAIAGLDHGSGDTDVARDHDRYLTEAFDG
jgi:hypothetical protein